MTLAGLAVEPFRLFFPLGVLAGILGVSLWPLHFWGVLDLYPGQSHARIMAYGLFGGFIFGFLGTAMPRMLSAKPFHPLETFPLALVHIAMVTSFAMGKIFYGDVLLLVLFVGFMTTVRIRTRQRKDTPPPGFILVGLAFLCVGAASVISIIEHYREIDPSWIRFQRLLSYQGFILLPILGIGPFILPRMFGMENRHDFPETLVPGAAWMKKAALALFAGTLVIISFVMEVKGWHRFAYGLRFATTLVYLLIEMPFHRAPKAGNVLGFSIRIAFIGVLAGFLTVAFFPIYRVTLLHLTLVGGFAVITFVVATRVVFGHSGNAPLLRGRNLWLLISVGLMLFGMATRMSGDFWPKLMVSHYIYGAIVWIGGVLLWAVNVLPKVLIPDAED